eukprot:1154410-Pelagomonas_calceolata.AAC.1
MDFSRDLRLGSRGTLAQRAVSLPHQKTGRNMKIPVASVLRMAEWIACCKALVFGREGKNRTEKKNYVGREGVIINTKESVSGSALQYFWYCGLWSSYEAIPSLELPRPILGGQYLCGLAGPVKMTRTYLYSLVSEEPLQLRCTASSSRY